MSGMNDPTARRGEQSAFIILRAKHEGREDAAADFIGNLTENEAKWALVAMTNLAAEFLALTGDADRMVERWAAVI